jgi:hypothetical protein
VKHTLLAVFAFVLFVNTLVVPPVAHADGQAGAGNCSGSTGNCKP